MTYARVIATLILLTIGLLILSNAVLASLDHTNPAGGSHHVDGDNDIVAVFSGTASGANSTNFVVHGRHSGVHTGSYSGNGSSRISFASASAFRAGERVEVTLTTGISGVTTSRVFDYRTRANRSSGVFNNDLLAAPYIGTWPNIAAPGRMGYISSSYYYGSAAGDVNGDGIPDIAICNPFSPGTVYLWMTPSNLSDWDNLAGAQAFNASLVTLNPTVSSILYGVTIADVDRDGYGDVIMSLSGKQPEVHRYNPTTSKFDTGVPFGLTSGGEHISFGDLNADGYLDAVVSGQPNFYCLNNGSGGFPSTVNLNNASFANENRIADFDNDGDLDILCIHGSGGVGAQDVIHLNNGNGTFSGTINVGTSQVSLGGEVGDMNGDGLVDIIIATRYGAVQYLNNGSGFSGSSTIASTSVGVGAIAIGDLDGDGDLDVVLGLGEAGSTGQSVIYYNDGDGSYGTSAPLGLASDGHWGPDIQIVDLDGDGDLDIYSGRATGGPFYLLNGADMYDATAAAYTYKHNGFDPSLTGITPGGNGVSVSRSTNISAGFNATMKGLNTSTFSVRGSLTGKLAGALSGNGSTSASFNPTADFRPGEIIELTIQGLYNEAQVLDLAGGSNYHTTTQPLVRGEVQRFRAAAGNGPLEFDQKVWNAQGAGTTTKAVVAGDLDGDGAIELVFGFDSGSPKVISVGASSLGSAWDVDGSANDSVRALDLADVDGDGDLDLAVGVVNGQSRVYLYDDTAGNFSGGTINFGTSSDDVLALKFADMNADGYPDIVLGLAGAADAVWLNDGSPAFNAGATFGGGYDTNAIDVADIDNDGDLDIVAGNSGAYNYAYLNDGRGNINGAHQIGSQGVQTRAIVAADFNGDGWVDIAVGEYGATDTIHLNDGNGYFANASNFGTTSSNTLAMQLGDFDGDGDLDIVSAEGNGAGTLYTNDGSGTFSNAAGIGSSNGNAPCLAVADLDGDDDLDVVLGRDGSQDTIRFNELMPTVGFSTTQYNVQENGGTATVTVTLSQAHADPVSVDWAATAGSATAGVDFTAGSGTLTFTPGQTSKAINVTILDDTIDEQDETVNLALSNVTNSILGANSATLNILDDDGAPTVRFASGTATASEADSSVTLTVELSNSSGLVVSVDYATSNGSATAGSDYTAASGTLTFSAGQTSKTVTVTLTGDSIDEPDEDFTVTLSNPVNATTGALGTTTVTIQDDDATPAINLGAATMLVNENAGTIQLTATLDHASASNIGVMYQTQNGSANGGDFVAAGGTLNFAPGVLSQTIDVTIIDDSAIEGDESFQLVLQSPTNAVLGTVSVTVITIASDPADINQVGNGNLGGGGGGGGGGCAADTHGSWWMLLALTALGLAAFRRRRA